MYHIVVPYPVMILNLKTRVPLEDENGKPKTMSLFDIICDVAFNDKRHFGAGWKAGVALNAIYDKFSEARPEEVVDLEDDHYERLNTSLLCLLAETEKDSGLRYDPKILMQVMPLLRPVKDAMTDEQYKEYLARKA